VEPKVEMPKRISSAAMSVIPVISLALAAVVVSKL